MTFEQFRSFCLSLLNAYEKMPFSHFFRGRSALLAFYVGEKIFCLIDADKFDKCTIKCTADEIAMLRDLFSAATKPYNFSSAHWLGLRFNDDMPKEMVFNYVRKSYELVKNSQQKGKKWR